MSNITKEAACLLDILPENDKIFALEFIKKLVLAWDPDYTKLTISEADALQQAENSGFISEEEIDWEHLEKYSEE